MGRFYTVFSLGYIILWFVGILRTTDGGSVTWYEPLPVETISDHNVDHTANKVQALEGFPKELSWNFSFTSDLAFSSLTINLGSTVVGGVLSSGQAGIQSGFIERFNFSWIPSQKFSLIIFNVTADDNGTFTCALTLTEGFGTNQWKSRMQVEIVDPPVITHISPNQTANESDVVTLSCAADGKPNPSIIWTRLSNNSVVTFPLNITGKQDEGFYRCTAKNDVGNDTADVFITVQNFGPENTNLTTDLSADNTVVVNTNFKLMCSAQANPPAKYRFYKEQESLFNTTAGSNVAEHTTSVTERINQVEFSCTPFNDRYGDGPTKTITVTVHYSPEIADVSSDKDVCEGSLVTLSCNTTGNPTPNITWTRVADDGTDSAPLLPVEDGKHVMNNIMTSSNGTYRCTANNGVGDPVNRTVRVTVRYSASVVRIVNSSNTVNEGGPFNMTCKASDGDPEPNVHWIKVDNGQRINGSILHFTNINRNDTGEYRCEAENHCGSHSGNQFVDVYYPPEITEPQNDTWQVMTGESYEIECQADGNPIITQYVWRNETSGGSTNGKYLRLNKVNDYHKGNYTCTASSDLGPASSDLRSASFTILIIVKKFDVYGILTLDYPWQPGLADKNSEAAQKVGKEVKNGFDKAYQDNRLYSHMEIKGYGPGSVLVYFVLSFSTPVTTDEALVELRAAVANGTIGPYKVTALKIVQDVDLTTTTTTSTPTDSTTASVATTPTSSPDELPWAIIGGAVGGAVVLFAIIGLVAWYVHKKRKCRRKNTKIHNSESEALGGENGPQDDAYARVNDGYAVSGPNANGANPAAQQQGAGTNGTDVLPPTYAVVDKSKKKKKKEEEENAYAKVDMSKKSKKKPKPGEMLYADLDDFKRRDMPAVSTSPEPLPPIKRPPAYEETQYADITQFVTGNATLPDTNNSQGTEMTYANVEGGKGKPKDTAKEGGNEEKPKETANEGGNEGQRKETRM